MNSYIQVIISIFRLFQKVRSYNLGLSPLKICYKLIYLYKQGYFSKLFTTIYRLTKYFKKLHRFFEKYQNTLRLLERVLYFYDRVNYIMYILRSPLNWFIKCIEGKIAPKDQLFNIFLHILIRYYFLINAVKPFYRRIYYFFKRIIGLKLN